MTERELKIFRELTSALKDHVEQESKRTGVPAERLCPCQTTTLREAEDILKRL